MEKNQTQDNVVIVNKLQKREIVISLIIALIITIIYAFILKLIGSSYPILNAFPTVIYLLGNYYVYKRSRLQYLGWIGYEIFFITLWIIAAVNGQDGGIIFLIGGISELIYGFIGLKTWKELENKQVKYKCLIKLYSKKSKP